MVRGRYNREESSERYNFFWLLIWTKGAECQGMWGASRRLKKRKGRALKVKRESVDVLWKRNPEIGVLHVIRTGIAGNEF